MLNVYSSPGDTWLLFPDCLHPTKSALRLHGPLSYIGSFSSKKLTTRELTFVQSEFDVASFAKIPAATALRLLALGIFWRLRLLIRRKR
jgi:hypothetical protein